MNTPVKFKIAKLLKKKGFDEKCNHLYFDGELKEITVTKVSYSDTLSSRYYIAPTITEVVMWLYKKHGIWINVNITRYGKFWCIVTVKEDCKDLNNPFTWEVEYQLHDFNLPAEAYEAAIEYTLNNLI